MTPFVVLLGKRPKMNPYIVSAVGVLILLGFYFEKWLMIALAAPVSLPIQIVETVLLGVLFALIMASGANTLPDVKRSTDPTPALSPIE